MRTSFMLLALTGCISLAQAVLPEGTAEIGPEPTTVERKIMREINIQQFKADRDADQVPVLFDVRTPGEYAEGHVPGAINIPLDQVQDRVAEFQEHKGKEIYLICRSGGRSGQAGRYLETQGLQAVNIMGGTAGWQTSGHPIER